MNYKLFLPGVLSLIAFGSCTTKAPLSADLPVVSFQTDVQPILSANCSIGSGCHSGSGHGHLSTLDTYDGAMRYVVTGNPHASRLYSTTRDYFGNVMPPAPNPRLTDQQMAQIFVWISQGAQNN